MGFVRKSSTERTGQTKEWMTSTAPDGWLVQNGTTIGSPASGANRANMDTRDLFVFLWENFDNTNLPILDSSGDASTRGASALADFEANKRMPLHNRSGLVPRMTGTGVFSGRNKVGPSLGERQEDNLQGHWHQMTSPGGDTVNSIPTSNTAGTGGSITRGPGDDGSAIAIRGERDNGTNGTPRVGNETRVAAFGVNYIIKL